VAAKRDAELKQYFPHKGTIKDHLIRFGLLTAKDRVRVDRRWARTG
jgi:hypothetical protein